MHACKCVVQVEWVVSFYLCRGFELSSGRITKMYQRNVSGFNTTYRLIRQRCKKCMSWHFITWSIKNSAIQPLWDNEVMRQQASNMNLWCSSKNTEMFLIFCQSEMRFIPIGSWHSWTKWQILCHTTVTVPPYQHNVTFCASQQLLFLLTNKISHFMLHNIYRSSLPTQCHILCFTKVTVPPYQHDVTFYASQ